MSEKEFQTTVSKIVEDAAEMAKRFDANQRAELALIGAESLVPLLRNTVLGAGVQDQKALGGILMLLDVMEEKLSQVEFSY